MPLYSEDRYSKRSQGHHVHNRAACRWFWLRQGRIQTATATFLCGLTSYHGAHAGIPDVRQKRMT